MFPASPGKIDTKQRQSLAKLGKVQGSRQNSLCARPAGRRLLES
jgi:hypothetical protein